MVTRAVAVGRGAVIDDSWGESIAVVADRLHTAVVGLYSAARPNGPVNDADGTQPMASDHYWTGSARIVAQSVPEQGGAEASADIPVRRYLVQIPRHTPAAAGMRVVVQACADPDLVGRVLVVRSSTRSSLAAQRDLICTLEGQDPTPEPLP